MLKSIKETGKLFTIEGIQNGQINIISSKYLLSLPAEKQVEVLTEEEIEGVCRLLNKAIHNTRDA